jgi:hypothetical protein
MPHKYTKSNPHWTQTPEGREALSKRSKGKVKGTKNVSSGEEAQVAYAIGYTQAWLQAYASRIGVPEPTLAYRVGEFLYRTSRRKVLGT